MTPISLSVEVCGASGDWTVKDVIAHMSGWHTPSLTDLRSVMEGNPSARYRWPVDTSGAASDDDKVQIINSWLYEQNKDRPLDEIIAESRGQWDDLRGIVTGLTEDQLNDPAAVARFEGTSLADQVMSGEWFSHFHDEHEAMLRDWLNEQRLR